MKQVLVGGFLTGAVRLLIANRTPLTITKVTKMDWARLSKSNRCGRMILYAGFRPKLDGLLASKRGVKD